MKKGALSLFFVLLLFIILTQRDVLSNENKIDPVVLESLSNHSSVEVIVELKESPKTRTINEESLRNIRKSQQEDVVDSLNENEFKENYHYANAMNGFSGNVSIEGLQKLVNNPDVKFIYLNKIRHVALNQSTPLVNATVVRQKVIGSFNLTGEGIGVCILDSGLNYSHSAFGGCSNSTFLNGSCKRVPNGYDMVNNDSDPYDDNGHGTHVAGIIGANDTTTFGVAPGALLVPIKVCNSGGSCSDSNIIKGFDWCIGNRSNPNFNISVISISLGDDVKNTNYCNSDTLASSINTAVGVNITVVISSGNNNYTGGITGPSCVENATSVGATYDANLGGRIYSSGCTDSNPKTDNITCFSNTASILDLLAPGADIVSTKFGRYSSETGTSMATPHVSGAVAILQQYKRLESNRTLTVQEVEGVLKNSSRLINDTGRTNLTFYRLDVISSLIYVDNKNPDLILEQPKSTLYNTNNSLPLNFTAVDTTLSNIWYNIDKGTNITITANTTFNASSGSHTLYLYANDSKGNVNLTSVSFSTLFMITLNSPNDFANISNALVTFNITVNFTGNLSNVSLFGNWTEIFRSNQTNSSGLTNTDYYFTTNLSIYDGKRYIWAIQACDNLSICSFTNNQTFKLDTTGLSINFTTGTTASSTLAQSSVFANVSVIGSNIENVTISLYNITSVINSTNYSSSASINWTSLQDGTYYFNSTVINLLGDINNTETRTIYLDNAFPIINLISPSNASTQTSSSITFNYNVSDVRIVNCTLFINGTLNSSSNSISVNTQQSFSISSLSNNNYWWNVSCTDYLNRQNLSVTNKLTVSVSNSSESGSSSRGSGGGGGGGGGTRKQADTATESKPAPESVSTTYPSSGNADINQLFSLDTKLTDALKEYTDNANNEQIIKSTEEVASKIGISRNLDIGASSTVLSLEIVYSGDEQLQKFFIYDIIPKDFANSSDEIIVSTTGDYKVVEKDPKILFVFNGTNKGRLEKVTYVVDKRIDKGLINSFDKPKIFAIKMDQQTKILNNTETSKVLSDSKGVKGITGSIIKGIISKPIAFVKIMLANKTFKIFVYPTLALVVAFIVIPPIIYFWRKSRQNKEAGELIDSNDKTEKVKQNKTKKKRKKRKKY